MLVVRPAPANLPASLKDVVDYRKSGLSLNHIVGCPLDCGYCVRHLFQNFRDEAAPSGHGRPGRRRCPHQPLGVPQTPPPRQDPGVNRIGDETARSLYDGCCRWSVDGRLGSGFRKRPRAQLLRIPLALSNQLDNPARENVFHETRPWLSLKSAACLIERCRHCRDHFGTERRAA